MPDNVKMSLSNALTICALIVACAVSYMGLSAKGEAREAMIIANKERILATESIAKENSKMLYQLSLQINDNSNKYNHILDSIGDIEDFIKSYNYKDANDDN